MKNRETMTVGVGISTIMMVFVVLCLTIFATVSYLQALSNDKSAEAYKNKVISSYQAEGEATRIEAQIESVLKNNGSKEEILALSDDLVMNEDIIELTIVIDEHSTLEIEWKIESNHLTCLRWSVHNKGDGNYQASGFDV